MSYVVLAAICWVCAAVFIVWFDRSSTRRHASALARKARELDFDFAATGQPFLGSEVDALSILPTSDSTVVSNLMRGHSGQFPMMVFELSFCDDSSFDIFSYNLKHTTFAAFRSPARLLPALQVERKDMVARVRESAGEECEVARSDPEFARRFAVRCTDRNQARAFFTPERLAHLRAYADDFRLECNPEWLLVYRPRMRVEAERLPDFVRSATTLALGLLTSNSSEVPAA